MSNHLTFIMSLLSKLPLPLLQSFGGGLARLFLKSPQQKTLRCAKLHLKIAFPHYSEQQLTQISQQATINEFKSYCEFLSIWGNSTEKNLKRIDQIHGAHYFHDAIANQKGLVMLIPHFGTWEIINSWLSQYTTLTIMYKPVKNAGADAFVKKARSREHANLVPTDESGVKQIFRALKQGGSTVILPDHSPHHHGDLVEWFGVPLYSSHLSAKLIQKTKAAALLFYAIRNEKGGFDLHIEPIDARIYDTDQGTRFIHQIIENLIQRYPEHYHWSYKRFKAHPHLQHLYNLSDEDALKLIRTFQTR